MADPTPMGPIVPPPSADDIQPAAGADVTAPAGVLRRVADQGLNLAQGVIGVPETFTGIADMATGGQVGKALENQGGAIGFRPKEARDYLQTLKSPEQQAAENNLAGADGFLPTVQAAIQNPSATLGTAIQSVPTMVSGGLVSGAALKGLGLAARVAPSVGEWAASKAGQTVAPIVAGALGEGATAAGQNAEQVRQEDPNGTLTGTQSGLLAGSGLLTAGLGFAAGKLANMLGITKAETAIAAGHVGALGEEGAAAAAKRSILQKVAGGALVDGVLQEFPQSYQEQVAQNLAQGKPWDEGAMSAGVQGAFAGGATGAIAGPLEGHGEKKETADETGAGTAPAAPPAPTGPFSAALLGLPVPGAGGPSIAVGPDGTATIPLTPSQQAAQRQATVQNGGPNGASDVIDTIATPVNAPNAADETPITPLELNEGRSARQLAYNDADPDTQAAYNAAFGDHDDITDVEAKPKTPAAHIIDQVLDSDIPFSTAESQGGTIAAADAGDADWLRSTGLFNEQEIHDALQQAPRGTEPGESSGGNVAAAPAANVTPAAAAGAGDQESRPSSASAPAAPAGPLEAAARVAQQVAPQIPKPAPVAAQTAAAGPAPVVEHTTAKGKLIKGVVRSDLTFPQAKQIDPYTFKKNGGFFIREAHLDKLEAAHPTRGAAPVAQVTAKTTPAAAPAEDEKTAQWRRTTSADRSAIVARAGFTGFMGERHTRTAMEKMTPQVRAKIQDAMTEDGRAKPPEVKEEANPYTAVSTDGSHPGSSLNGTPFITGIGRAQVQEDGVTHSSRWFKMSPQERIEASVRSRNATTPIQSDIDRASKSFPNLSRDEQDKIAAAMDHPYSTQGNGTPGSVKVITGAKEAAAEVLHAAGGKRLRVDDNAPGLRGSEQQSPEAQKARKRTVQKEAFDAGYADSMAGKPNNGWKAIDGTTAYDDAYKLATKAQATQSPGKPVAEAQPAPSSPVATAFPDAAANAARERIKARLAKMNPDAEEGDVHLSIEPAAGGIDHEMMADGILLAGNTIEKGARTFEQFAKAMVADMGPGVKPYLKSWYMGVKFDPRAGAFTGMDKASAVEDADVEAASTLAPDIDAQAHEAATSPTNDLAEPTAAQKEAGNYKKGHISVQGLDITVENPRGSTRTGTRPDGTTWSHVMSDHYGYVKGTIGADGEQVDVYVGQHPEAPTVYVVDQVNKDGTFDEHKAMIGFNSEAEARAAYSSNFDDKWTVGAVTPMSMADFKTWVDSADAMKPLSKATPISEHGTLTQHFYEAIKADGMPENNLQLARMVTAFDGQKPTNGRMKQAQEALEAAISMRSRDLVQANVNEGPKTTFAVLQRAYQAQPNLNVRTSTSVANQAYSTPAPLAYLASNLAGITPKSTVYEPTAGTGMLLIGTDPKNASLNELNPDRRALLKEQGFPIVTPHDASDYTPKGRFDAVVANPPFGSIKGKDGKPVKVEVDGYKIGQIDHLIAARALEAMKPDGKATLIIGANKIPGGLSTDDRIFFNWLYSHYNVTSHFEAAGPLYARQGAAWPVRVITINGRQESTRVSPAPGVIPRADTWEQVYGQYERGMDAARQSADAGAAASHVGSGQQAPGRGTVPGIVGEQAPVAYRPGPEAGTGDDGNVVRPGTESAGDLTDIRSIPVGNADSEQRLGASPVEPDVVGATGNPATIARSEPSVDTGATALEPEDSQFQATYVARSSRKDKNVLIPVNMQQPTQDALSKLEDAVGDIDKYAAKQLGYKNVEALHAAFMGLQVDSVASAIYQAGLGKGVIIADQTGIGKGRQAAAMIRWAASKGYTPIFVSVKPSLFTDMYGDLHDIGTDDIAPFILNKDEHISGPTGEKLFTNNQGNGKHKATMEGIAQSGQLPKGTNAMFMTYSQIQNEGIQRGVLGALAPNAFFVLDESHNAAGESGAGDVIRGALDGAKGVTYLSATYAKRPDNMPLYSKTDIGDAISSDSDLEEAMAAGGLSLQTVVSNNLVKAGQMFRRERSFAGIKFESKTDTENRVKHEQMSDKATEALRAITSADHMFHEQYFKEIEKQVKAEGKAARAAGNRAEKTVDHTEFSSVVHNFVRQMLLGIKAQTAADDAIAALKAGQKPIIAVENTMGSFLDGYAQAHGLKSGDPLGTYDYRVMLSRALDRTRAITVTDQKGTKTRQDVKLSDLGPITRAAYDRAQEVIDGLKLDIPASPIDWMRQQITNAGHTVAEITGRKNIVDYSDPKNPALGQLSLQEQKDKVATTRQFNAGALDALILNVAGSTGISLHASEKFADQRPRQMIVAQPAQDINIFMQMLGRPNRTGQVTLPGYSLLSADLPSERRPNAVLAKKMKSLNANTSSNTESDTSVGGDDFLNKYGDQVVNTYLLENPAMARALGVTPVESTDGSAPIDIARTATGRLALQPVEQQKSFYDDVSSTYSMMIKFLNDTNANDLEPRTVDYDAKVEREETLFEGENPESPFGQDAVYNEYSIKAQGKQMTPAEINKVTQENLNGLKPGEHALALTSPLISEANKFIAAQGEGEARHAATVVRDNGLRFMQDHAIGQNFRVDIHGDAYTAVVTNIRNTYKGSGNPFAMSKIQVTIAVNGSIRSLTVPASQFKNIEVSAMGRNHSVEQLFKEGPPNQREIAKIVTGNLLGAYGEIKGSRGTIINFSKADGTVEQGILLPKAFDFDKNTRQDFRLKSGSDAVSFLTQSQHPDIDKYGISSRDQKVRVLPDGKGIEIKVPKTKKDGAKYFLNADILAHTGDFVSSGNNMVARVSNPTKAAAALDAMMKQTALYTLPSMAAEAKGMASGGEHLDIEPSGPTSSPAFKDWFSGSKTTNPDGSPMVLYHATTADISKFAPGGPDGKGSGRAIWLGTERDNLPAAHNMYEGFRVGKWKAGANIMPVYASVKRPLVIDDTTRDWARSVYGEQFPQIITPDVLADLKKDYDGILFNRAADKAASGRVFRPEALTEVIAFNPEQVKSAIGNQGTFDPSNPDIRADLEAGRPQATSSPTTTATPEHQAKAAQLLANMRVGTFKDAKGGINFQAVEPNATEGSVEGNMLKTAQFAAKRLFGLDVVYVKDAPGQSALFGGVADAKIPNTIFINVDSKRPAMSILGHELTHVLRSVDPVLYRVLDKRLQALYTPGAPGAYFSKIREAYEAKGLKAPRDWDEEMNADIVGDHFMDPEFWNDIAAKGEPGQFAFLANRIMRIIDKIKNFFAKSTLKPFETEQYLSDLDAARDAVSSALSQFAADQAREPNRPPKPGARSSMFAVEAKQESVNEHQADPQEEPMLSIVSDPTALMQTARDKTAQLFDTPGKLNWWHKTVGSPYNLAQRSPLFKPVFDHVQDFLKDVSKYASETADTAPNLLPKLEKLSDLKKSPVSVKDSEAISKPIFEGTLNWGRDERGQPIRMTDLEESYASMSPEGKAGVMMRKGLVSENELKRWKALPIDSYNGAVNNRFEATVLKPGIVWSPDELKSRFGLDEKQAKLYTEFRGAIDKSLTDLAISDMVRTAGKDVDPIKQMAMDSGSAQDAAVLLRDHLLQMAEADPDARNSNALRDTANVMIDKADRVKDLQERGYAPLSRFGKYTVDVVDKDGQRQYFSLFENRFDAAKTARAMEKAYPGGTVTQGTMSQEQYKLFQGVSPETAELFGNMMGLDSDGDSPSSKAFQAYLKLAKNNRSTMKRLIERKGIAGFSADPGRVLANFAYSNARQTSNNLHAGEIASAVNDIPQQQGELKDAASKLKDYVSNPQLEAPGFRGLLFTQYIGGSIASAMVNLTQPLQTTMPYLSQFGGIKQSAKMVKNAARDALRPDSALKAAEPDLFTALQRAEEEGTVSPQEVHQLMAQARGAETLQGGDGTKMGNARAAANNAMSRLQFGWGKLFSTAEQYNRRLTFIASYRTAKANGMNPQAAFKFAEKAISETQFVANKGNRPRWARGAVGSTLFTFKSYSINYLEMVARMAKNGPEGRKAAALALGTLMLMSGAGGLPFSDDVNDLIDGIAQHLGYNFNSASKRTEFLEGLFGKAGGDFVDKGVSGISGFPLDLSGRMGMGNLIPGTGLLTAKADHTSDVAELFGPAGDFAKRAFQGAGSIVTGAGQAATGQTSAAMQSAKEGLFAMAPKAITNLRQGADMAATGAYHDTRGRKVLDTNAAEAVSKMIGFQPSSVAQVQSATGTVQNAIAQQKLVSGEITKTWAAGIAQKDPSMVAQAQQQLRDWNAKNPEARIKPNLSAIQSNARQMAMDKSTRIEKTSPKAMRADIRQQLATSQ